jgi:hypothetical protein
MINDKAIKAINSPYSDGENFLATYKNKKNEKSFSNTFWKRLNLLLEKNFERFFNKKAKNGLIIKL